MDGRISSYSFALDMISRNTSLQRQMADIQEQLATGVKSQDYKGYGISTQRLQNARIEVQSIDSYMYNIEVGVSRIKQMTLGIDEIEEQTNKVMQGISILPQEGDVDYLSLKSLATSTRDIVIDIMKTKIGDDYIFAGSDIQTSPIDNATDLTSRVKTQVASWLDGTIDADTFMNNINGYTDSQIGYSLGVQDASSIYIRADDHFEIDYTVKANDAGLKDILVGLTALSELNFPDETTDLADRESFYTVVNEIYTKVQNGMEELRGMQIKLASAEGSAGRKLENYKTDKGYLQTTIEDIQAVDPAEAVVRFQSLQTALEASFQATSIMSSMSLARLL